MLISDSHEFIRWRVSEDMHLQSDFACDDSGEVVVDVGHLEYVGHLETIEADFASICNRVGTPASLPHRNRSSHRDYRDDYTAETRNLVAPHFAPDIGRFGYVFDGLVDT